MYRKIGKRIFDTLIAFFCCVILLPVFFVTSFLIMLFVGWPVIYRQLRIGQGGKRFVIYKFRTMRDVYDANGELLPDAQRLNLLGKFVRKFSLDEFPQFWNVLLGDMSLVGPRPLIESDFESNRTIGCERRHLVKPGITGLAQIKGRNDLSWKNKFNLDLLYVDHLSFWLDIKIIFLTIIIFLYGKGVEKPGYVLKSTVLNGQNVD